MLYFVETSICHEDEPYNENEWQSEQFPDLTEAGSEEEAIELCIDYVIEDGFNYSDIENVVRNADNIEYTNNNGDRCTMYFRAKRTMLNNLRVLREKAGMSQQELAEKTGLTEEQVSAYEYVENWYGYAEEPNSYTDDLRVIPLWDMLRIAEVLHCTVEDITLKQM